MGANIVTKTTRNAHSALRVCTCCRSVNPWQGPPLCSFGWFRLVSCLQLSELGGQYKAQCEELTFEKKRLEAEMVCSWGDSVLYYASVLQAGVDPSRTSGPSQISAPHRPPLSRTKTLMLREFEVRQAHPLKCSAPLMCKHFVIRNLEALCCHFTHQMWCTLHTSQSGIDRV